MTAQYQSFPGASGDSRTLDKLKALKLPDVSGGSFLDVGCNEGFFCGFAHYMGATRVLGIDHSKAFVERAQERFPDCEFRRQGWDHLPDERFDVILLASALHYAEDQPALIARLVEQLAPGGVLVLELGIVSSVDSEWVKVKRGIDERWFATMPKLREVLADYAWKWMGPSIQQDGDPVKRHVVHISRRLPEAWLLMRPPGFGKTSIAQRLFLRAKVEVVSGDQLIGLVARGKREAPPVLRDAILHEYSPFALDRTIARIFDAGLGEELVRFWTSAGAGREFALDVFVPEEYQSLVQRTVAAAGYLPVRLEWDRPGAPLLSAERLEQAADSFYLSMADPEGSAGEYPPAGFVDDLRIDDGQLLLRGWAVTRTGRLPVRVNLQAHGVELPMLRLDRELRADVQAHMKTPHALFGFQAVFSLPPAATAEALSGLAAEAVADDDTRTALQFSEQVLANVSTTGRDGAGATAA